MFYDFCKQTHKIEISKGAIFLSLEASKSKNQINESEKNLHENESENVDRSGTSGIEGK